MNQQELNRIAINYMNNKTVEVVTKLTIVLDEDMKDSSNEASFECLRDIYNHALFHVLFGINCPFNQETSSSEEMTAYISYAAEKVPQLMKLCANMRDFEPQNQGHFDDFDVTD